MIPRLEHIGSDLSWPRKLRRWWNDLLGSRYCQLLERDLMQARLERDRALADLKATQERLVEVLAASKGIPWRPLTPPEREKEAKLTSIPPTRWQETLNAAIQENAKAEEDDRKKLEAEAKSKEN